MRVLLVNDLAVPLGGAEVLVFNLRDELRRQGHDARIFASDATPNGMTAQADYYCFGPTSRARGMLQSANPWAASSLRRVIRDFRPDVVHVTMFMTQLSPLILPVLRGVPTLFHAVWYRYVCPTGLKRLPNGSLCRRDPGVCCLRSRCVPVQDWLPFMAQHALAHRWQDAFAAIVAV